MDGEKIKKDTEETGKHSKESNNRTNNPYIKSGGRKRRKVRPSDKSEVEGYDSNWEYLLHTKILKSWEILGSCRVQ